MKLETMNIETDKYLKEQFKCGDDYSLVYQKQTEYFNRLRDADHDNGDSFSAKTGTNIARLEMTISELTQKLRYVNELLNPVTKENKTPEHIKF